ncbi:hypothetical protein DIPPA_28449 [Diplonema papillatum]|nr:hypothetical protein DIPPA_28449 [Diplonema papillatum]
MEECGHVWGPGPLSRTLRNGATFDPLTSAPSKRGHEVRADLRAKTWSRLVARRPGFEGVQRADLERTNSFWRMRECPAHTARLIRVALAGGVNTAEFTSRMRMAGAEPQAPSCKHCGSGDTEDEKHVFWVCGAYSHIRRRETHAELMAANRADWPRCTLEHGVVVPENAQFSRRLQEMMAEILAERHHHHANDGQPIAVCTEHSTTKCGVQDGGGVLPQRASCLPHAWQRNLPRVQKAPYADAEATGGMLQPQPPPVQQAERPINPRTQQEEGPPHPPRWETPVGKRAARAPLAATKKETATTGRATKRPPPTPGTSERPALKKRVLGTPKEGPIAGRKRKKTKATTPDSRVHRRKKKVPRASSSQKRPGTTGTPMPSKVENGHSCPPSYSPTQSLESQASQSR